MADKGNRDYYYIHTDKKHYTNADKAHQKKDSLGKAQIKQNGNTSNNNTTCTFKPTSLSSIFGRSWQVVT